MRSLLFLSLVCWGTASCSGGAGLEVYNGSDQTTPPTDRQQSPANVTQQAALDPQGTPILDAQSVAPTNGDSGVIPNGGSQRVCEDWCQKNLICQSMPPADCAASCAEGFAKVGACAGPLTAYLSCLAASPDYQCGTKQKDLPKDGKDVPAGCEAAAFAYTACVLTLESPEPPGTSGQGNGGGMQGMAGASGRL